MVAATGDVKGEVVAAPARTTFAIFAITANYVAAASVKGVEKAQRWEKPISCLYKLNTDAFYHVNGEGAAGMVLRNDRGEALAGYGCPLSNMLSVATAEAMKNLSIAPSRSIVAQDRQLQCQISCHRRSTKTPLHEIPTDSWVPCIHRSYYQNTASKWALTTSGLLDEMSLAVIHALWFGEIPLV